MSEALTVVGAGGLHEAAVDQLPVYSGLVETARANNRQGFPIGAAYLRQATALLTSSILPAAGRLYAAEARRLNDDYRTGTSNASLVALVAAAALALVLMLLAQRYVARMSRRILNVLMVLATVALAGVSAWAVIGLVSEQNSLATAQRRGSDSVELLSAANVLLSRAQGDLSLALVSRGTDVTDTKDFARVKRVLAKSGLASRVGPELPLLPEHDQTDPGPRVGGQLGPAIALEPNASNLSDALSKGLDTRIAAAQARFTSSAAHASSALSGLGLAIPLVTALAALLALLGLRQRINEYR